MPQGCCECSAVFFIHVACGLWFSSQNAKVLQNKCHQPHAVHGRSRYIPFIIGWLFWHVGIPARWIPWMGMNQDSNFSWITLVVFPRSGLHTFEPTFFEHVHFLFGQERQPESPRKEEITRKESEGTAEMGYLNESNISQGLSQNRECVKNMVIEWDFGLWHFGTASFNKQTWVCNQQL